jgi:hypothetical protein
MIESEKLQVLAQLNQEMIDAVAKLQNALEKSDSLEVEKIKALILVLQKKISNSIGA